jgi:hypothetical protein
VKIEQRTWTQAGGLATNPDSQQAGEFLAQALPHSIDAQEGGAEEKLAHVLVLSDGLSVNGSNLLRGLVKHLPEGIAVTGGLAGDGARFGMTRSKGNVLFELDGRPALGLYKQGKQAALVGFYSYGEIAPFLSGERSELHNQTMTVTTFAEE